MTRLVDAATSVAELAGERAATADADGRLADDVVASVVAAGFARHFVAAERGGAERTFVEMARAVEILGRRCASTAWFASLAATLGRMAGYLPAAGQDELWRDGPDTVIVGSLLPLGTAVPVDGGWVLSGAWPYVSSVEFADWALLLGRCPRDVRRFFAVPKRFYRIEETWDSVGMRATGSHTVHVDELFVPQHRSYERSDLDRGRPSDSKLACHLVPLEAVSGITFAAPLVGAAEGALRAVVSAARGRRSAPRPPAAAAMDPAQDGALTRSASEITAARLLVENIARRADEGGLSPLDEAVGARDCAFATDLVVAGTDRAVRSAGTSGLSQGQAVQRFWRDVHSGASHIMLQSSRAAVGYGRVLFSDDAAGGPAPGPRPQASSGEAVPGVSAVARTAAGSAAAESAAVFGRGG